MDELTREFLVESQEGLDRMERCLTELEERPQDGELLTEIFRSVHTIKGTTGFLGYLRLESLSHAGENLLGMLRDNKLLATAEIISALLDLTDALRAILRSIEAAGDEGHGDDYAMIESLRRAMQTSEVVRVESDPTLAEVAGHSSLARSAKRDIQVEEQLLPAHDPGISQARAQPQASAADSTLRVDIDLLNLMMNLVGEVVLTHFLAQLKANACYYRPCPGG